MDEPGEGNGFPHVVDAANPCDRALHAQSETGMRHAAVAAQVEVPAVGIPGQLVRLDLLLEELGIARLAKQRASVLSGGERRRLEISRALATGPM